MPADLPLFAYGSLMFPQVWKHVVGHPCPTEPATLAGHTAFRVREQNFPGMIATTASAQTEGQLVRGLSSADWQVLDAFEDVFYDRETVMVVNAAGAPHEAQTYIVRTADHGVLSEEVWTAGWFQEHGLAPFLHNIGAC